MGVDGIRQAGAVNQMFRALSRYGAGLVKRLLLIVLAVFSLLWVVPTAGAAEIQQPEEQLEIELHAKGGYAVYAILRPRRDVAVLFSERGERQAETRGGRWSGVNYAAEAPAEALAGFVHVRIGHVAALRGHFVADKPPRVGHNSRFCRGRRPVSESGHFAGRIVFRGDRGYLRLRRSRAAAYRSRTFDLRCQKGHAHHEYHPIPGLFGYVEPPMSIFGPEPNFLFAQARTKHRTFQFLAERHPREPSTTFKAAVFEWLPGDVATTRFLEVSRVRNSTFQFDEAERRPRRATVAPPAPFSGKATYSRKRHSLRGNLRASFLGETLRITSGGADAEICRSLPSEPSWVCG
jgi:hypothetical protein